MSSRNQWHGLRAVQRRLRWHPPQSSQTLLLGEVNERSLVTWVQQSSSKTRPVMPMKDGKAVEHRYCAYTSRRQQLLDASQGPLGVEVSTSHTQAQKPSEIFLLSGGSHQAGGASQARNVYRLPFTLAVLAARVRDEASVQRADSARLLTGASSQAHLQLAGQSAVSSSSCATHMTSASALCSPQSKDCLIVELAAPSALSLGDALTVAVHQLRRNGALLMFSPQPFFIPRQAMEYLEWQFASHHLGHLSDGSTFLLCSSPTGSDTAPRLRQSDFPGLLPRGVRRKRQWDRYGRNRELYVANVTPDFGAGLFSKDSFEAGLRQKQEQEEAFEERDNAFFGVSHDMVEKNRYASRPED